MNVMSMLPTIVINSLINTFYKVSCILPINNNKVCFSSLRSNELEGNLAYIDKELKERRLPIKYVYLLNKYIKKNKFSKLFYVIKILQSTYHLATSRYFLIDDYHYPIYVIKPRSGTEIIQLWHAAGAFKKFGQSIIGKEFGPSKNYLKYVKVHENYTKAIVSSKEVIPYYAEAFNMKVDNIMALGLPRLDYFYEKRKHQDLIARFLTLFPELTNKRLILYAPTYRGKSYDQPEYKSPIDFHLLKEILGDEYAIIVKLHPYITKGLVTEQKDSGFVYEITEFNINELMIISNMLITDYSSVIFEYSLLDKPILFMVSDLNEYIEERDFYYDFEDFVPGPIVDNTELLGKMIVRNEFNMNEVEQFKNKFFDYLSGDNSKRIVDKLFTFK